MENRAKNCQTYRSSYHQPKVKIYRKKLKPTWPLGVDHLISCQTWDHWLSFSQKNQKEDKRRVTNKKSKRKNRNKINRKQPSNQTWKPIDRLKLKSGLLIGVLGFV
ncbi:hypothetical protein BpHYR1_007036 [Brachionus plicatilis]|uniref:Uncharacterized protein n=1 Tax=Brachionus plicatilis TaxID=10195 RepID=A0A3M7SI16_BRAPC|nr:hypothetical protein BpHYR1_007036 [Brachionus plicatilis]